MIEGGFRKMYESDPDVQKEFEQDLSLEEKFNLKNTEEIRMEIKESFKNRIMEAKKETETIEEWAEKVEEETGRFGFIFLDVNGLKAVNDLVSHSAGDKYLFRIIAKISESEKVKEFIGKNNLEVTSSRMGGDEFGILVEGESSLGEIIDEDNNLSVLTCLRETILNEIEKIKTDDIIDFKRSEVLEKMSEIERELLSQEPDYSLRASVAGGECLFSEAFRGYAEKPKQEENLSFIEMINGLMGDVIDLSEERQKNNKEEFKKNLNGLDCITLRTSEERELAILEARNREVIAEKDKIIEELKRENEELKKRL